ncbi:twin-arginine translocase subunit TatC [Verrucomicrobium sp. BvORR106]|uniref:twin-arginine translocase subunit TatC n=1 Tax=Verrucomicrobium sp. BvORR106 TaxID=1403819 RepID=UPI00056DB9BC|nr:twin-arginine translocase subunit TatC [Verrucomicrobium sp. BvORR106]
MFNWIFKKVVTLREKVAVDLGGADEEKPFLDHLDDLRKMIVNMTITLLVVTLGTFFFYEYLIKIIEHPLVMAGIRDKISLQNLKVTGGFMTVMNISLVAGVILAFPLLLYFLLQFILPGLRTTEKKVIFPALAVGGGLFLTGVLFAYFVVCPRALLFFYEFSVSMDQLSASQGGTAPPDKLIWERVEYVKFVCQFVLIFGACFELPVVVMALVKMDVLNYKVMKTSRAWAAIIICVVAAVITPTQDALTLGLLAVPMYALYEICIWLAYYMEKKDRQLYPEYYKEQDEESKAVEVADDWDNENYNPWNTGDSDDEEEENDEAKRKVKQAVAAPAPTPAPSSSIITESSTANDFAPKPDDSVTAADTSPEEPKPEAKPETDPTADKRDTD